MPTEIVEKDMIVTPSQEVAKVNVTVPSLVWRPVPDSDRTVLTVQWFGKVGKDANGKLAEGTQFYFDLKQGRSSAALTDENTGDFHTVFIGQVREWPRPDQVDLVMITVCVGLDTSVLYMANGKLPIAPKKDYTESPTCVVMVVLPLRDPNLGMINPLTHTDLTVIDEEQVKVNGYIGRRLVCDPTVLPPLEVIAWRSDWKRDEMTCPRCGHLRRGHSAEAPLGTIGGIAFLCTTCKRRWWKFNAPQNLWKHITSQVEWDGIRRYAYMIEAGYDPVGQ